MNKLIIVVIIIVVLLLNFSLPETLNPNRHRVIERFIKPPAVIKTAPTARPRYFLSGCAKVGRSELAYLMEWLEYHRLTGFDKMILYLDDSPSVGGGTSSLEDFQILSDLFEAKIQKGFLEIRSISSVIFDTTADQLSSRHVANTHRLTQQSVVLHCFESLRRNTEWFMHFDVDEYLVLEGRAGENDKAIRLADWLQTLYDPPNLNDSEAKRRLRDLYVENYLSGIYIPALNYGLGKNLTLFTPRVQFVRDHLFGNIKILHANNLPEYRTDHQESDPAPAATSGGGGAGGGGDPAAAAATGGGGGVQEKVGRLQRLLLETNKNGTDSAKLLDLISERNHIRLITRLPMVLEEMTLSMPSHRLNGESWLEILKHWEILRPSCGLNSSSVEPLDEQSAYNYLHSQTRPGCRGSTLDAKYTAMGKTLLWTGHRFAAPAWHEEYVKARISREAQLVLTLNLERTRGGRKSGRRKISKLLAEGMKARVDAISGHGRRRFEGGLEKPIFCRVPWIHGCAHNTKAPTPFGPQELKLNHYMLRSLEARTAGDASWRKGSMGWGKLGDMDKDLEVLQLTNAIERPVPPLAKATRESIESHFEPITQFRPAQYSQAAKHAWPKQPLAQYWAPQP